MFRRLFVFALLLLAPNLLALFADDWQFIGPKDFGARVISLAVDPKNADHVFAGSASTAVNRVKILARFCPLGSSPLLCLSSSR